ncbi:acyl-CoA thioesterase [Tsukamurella serpentis]
MSISEVKIALRWSDQDALGHVNNVTMMRLLEEARIRFLVGREELGAGAEQPVMFVAHQEIDYATPLVYSDEPATIAVWITRIGNTGFDIGYQVKGADGVVAAIAETSMVVVDGAGSGRPVPIPEKLRALLEELHGEPVPFRRRRVSV